MQRRALFDILTYNVAGHAICFHSNDDRHAHYAAHIKKCNGFVAESEITRPQDVQGTVGVPQQCVVAVVAADLQSRAAVILNFQSFA